MNFNALDLNLIRVFDALMQERSVTRAGERIGLSQPAMSAALNRLRHLFNDQLFVRQGHDMLPTPLAADLAEPARTALAEIEGMIRSVRGLEPVKLARTFTLLGADFFSMLLMPHLARQIRIEAPLVRMRLLDSARGDVMRLLQENVVDIALEPPLDRPEWASCELLFHSPFAIVAARANPSLAHLPDGAVIPLDLFCTLPHAIRSIDGSMSGLVDAALAGSGHSRLVSLALPHFQGVALAVAASDHLAALPVQFVTAFAEQLGLRSFRSPIDIPVPYVNMYWHARYDNDPVHKWIRAHLRKAIADLGFNQI